MSESALAANQGVRAFFLSGDEQIDPPDRPIAAGVDGQSERSATHSGSNGRQAGNGSRNCCPLCACVGVQ